MSIGGGPALGGCRFQSKAGSRFAAYVNDINKHDLEFIANRLKNVQITDRDAIEVIKKFGQDPDALIYFDPPYLKETRIVKNGYGNNEVDIQFHVDAADELNKCDAGVCISGFQSDLYSDLYKDWTRIDKTGSYASSNKQRTESIWINYNQTIHPE